MTNEIIYKTAIQFVDELDLADEEIENIINRYKKEISSFNKYAMLDNLVRRNRVTAKEYLALESLIKIFEQVEEDGKFSMLRKQIKEIRK